MENKHSVGIFGAPLQDCPICGVSKIAKWKTKRKNGVDFVIFKCESCDSAFLNPRPIRKWLEEVYCESGHGLCAPISLEEVLAAELECPSTSVDAERIVSKAVMHGNEKHSANRVLDVGSGYGFYSAAAMRKGLEVVAVNPSVWENVVYRQMNGFSPIKSFLEDANLDGPFHIVVLSQVLEHISDPAVVLRKIRDLMEPGGVLALAVPNKNSFFVKIRGVDDNSCFWVPEHQNYFSIQGVTRLLARSGFEVREAKMISRIPYQALSKRLGLKGRSRILANQLVRIAQAPICGVADSIGLGLYINIWAHAK